MGCVPAERRQSGATASVAVRKASLRQANSIKSRDSSTSIENQPQKTNEVARDGEVIGKTGKKNKVIGSPKRSLRDNAINAVEQIQQQSPEKRKKQKLVNPGDTLMIPVQAKPQGLSKIVSVHSLGIHSSIKIAGNPGEKSSGKTMEAGRQVKGVEIQRENRSGTDGKDEVNITFNNNNFAVANSSKATGSLGMGKRWREQTLRQELKAINEEHFRKIPVDSMSFH